MRYEFKVADSRNLQETQDVMRIEMPAAMFANLVNKPFDTVTGTVSIQFVGIMHADKELQAKRRVEK